LFRLAPDVQQGPGKKHGNQDNYCTAKQQYQQVAQLSPGLAFDLPGMQEPKHREWQSPESRPRQQMGNHRPGHSEPAEQK
jgi:hypothetical protein